MLTRAAIVLLVVLNLGAAAWWLLHAPMPAEAAPAPPPGAARLHLASDAGAGAQAAAVQAQATAQIAPAAVAAAPAPAQPTTRTAAAPANVQADAQAETPAETVAASAAGTCEGGEGPAAGWRVYLPRLPSADAAKATAARIGEAGFSDYLVVADGADANTIALGRYGTESAARRRTASLRAAGFPARCARIPPATPA